MKTILITGCSTGFGRDTARHFATHGWEVVATMRAPSGHAFDEPNVRILRLDVTEPSSIDAVVAEVGSLDAVVNNAGIGLMSVFEGTSGAYVRSIFETNLFGMMSVTRAFLPKLRERRGVVVNVSSSVTHRPLPLLAVYSASKAAMNAFSSSLALELAPLGVRVRVVAPGRAPSTAFGVNARATMQAGGVGVPEPYAAFVEQTLASFTAYDGPVTTSDDVVQAVWQAVTDPASPPMAPAGADAVASARA